MKLYLVQHAKAVATEQNPQRPLSREGRQEIQKIASLNCCEADNWRIGWTVIPELLS